MRTAILAAALTMALTAMPTLAKPESIDAMKARWERLNDQCRDRFDDRACAIRDRTERALERRGVCWGYRDTRVIAADYRWHPCSERRPRGWRPN
jgi:hypothetical protein